jgi:hypothetical protein
VRIRLYWKVDNLTNSSLRRDGIWCGISLFCDVTVCGNQRIGIAVDWRVESCPLLFSAVPSFPVKG